MPDVFLEVSPRWRVVVDEKVDCWVLQRVTSPRAQTYPEAGQEPCKPASSKFHRVSWVRRRDGLSGLLKTCLWHAGLLKETKTCTGEVRAETHHGKTKDYPVAIVSSKRVPKDDWFPGVLETLEDLETLEGLT